MDCETRIPGTAVDVRKLHLPYTYYFRRLPLARPAAATQSSGVPAGPIEPRVPAVVQQLLDLLSRPEVPIGMSVDDGLRRLAWSGLHAEHRATVWRLLTGHAPTSSHLKEQHLHRKRAEYFEYASLYFNPSKQRHPQNGLAGAGNASQNDLVGSSFVSLIDIVSEANSSGFANYQPHEQAILHQLALDLPRHRLSIFRDRHLGSRLGRSLFILSLRSPAVGYVQGIDDVVAIFFMLFLAEALMQHSGLEASAAVALATTSNSAALASEVSKLPAAALDAVEADAYWSSGRMLSWVQDHFVQGQPGVVQLMEQVEKTVTAEDEQLLDMLATNNVRFVDFVFPWVHCLLTRELPPVLAMRLWDTYLAIGDGFSSFHGFVCAALLLELRPMLKDQPLHILLRRLQNPTCNDDGSLHRRVTFNWLDTLIADAYLLMKKHAK